MAGAGARAQGPAPADGILDETRALSAASRQQLAEALRQFRTDLKCEAWVTASSFMPAGASARQQARTARRAWSGERAAVLMAYDRATNSGGLSFSPDLWQRYPAAELVETMQDARRLLSDQTLALDERLMLAAHGWMGRLRALETVRLQQSLLIQRDEKRLALIVAGLLGAFACVAAVLGLLARRRDASAAQHFHFPEVQVSQRFGAPYGGGVTAELKPGAPGL